MGDGYKKVRAEKGGENVLLPRESKEFERESINFKGEGCRGWREQCTPKTLEKKTIEL